MDGGELSGLVVRRGVGYLEGWFRGLMMHSVAGHCQVVVSLSQQAWEIGSEWC